MDFITSSMGSPMDSKSAPDGLSGIHNSLQAVHTPGVPMFSLRRPLRFGNIFSPL